MSSSLKGPTVLASFAVQPLASETESERYFDNHYKSCFWTIAIFDITLEKRRTDNGKKIFSPH